jgi:coenzyme Q-binding protein COQ10
MRSHRETRLLPYTPEQVFDVVADVEAYPQFLPWCTACRIRRRESAEVFVADMAIGFKMVRETFTSRVTLDRPRGVTVDYLDGPFRHLVNTWTFRPYTGKAGGRATEVEFFLEFEFRSRLLESLIGLLFEEAVRRMVAAFEARAAVLYAAPTLPSS